MQLAGRKLDLPRHSGSENYNEDFAPSGVATVSCRFDCLKITTPSFCLVSADYNALND